MSAACLPLRPEGLLCSYLALLKVKEAQLLKWLLLNWEHTCPTFGPTSVFRAGTFEEADLQCRFIALDLQQNKINKRHSSNS